MAQHLHGTSERDGGQTQAMNKGLQLATGDIIGWLNPTDDRYRPGCFDTVEKVFAQNPEIDILYGDYTLIGTNLTGTQFRYRREINFSRLVLFYHRCLCIPTTSCFFRRRVLTEGHTWLDESLQYAMDHDFFARLATKGYRFRVRTGAAGGLRFHSIEARPVPWPRESTRRKPRMTMLKYSPVALSRIRNKALRSVCLDAHVRAVAAATALIIPKSFCAATIPARPHPSALRGPDPRKEGGCQCISCSLRSLPQHHHRACAATPPTSPARRMLADFSSVRKVTMLTGEWQAGYFREAFHLDDPRLEILPIAISNRSVSRNLWYWRALPSLARTCDADIVHLAYPMPLLRSAYSSPVVVSLHDLYPYDIPRNFGAHKAWLNRAVLRDCLRNVDAVACVSEPTRTRLHELFPALRPEKTSVVPNSIGLSHECANIALPDEIEDSPFLLCVAQHRANKNLALLLRSFRLALDRHVVAPETKLVILGNEGPETTRACTM